MEGRFSMNFVLTRSRGLGRTLVSQVMFENLHHFFNLCREQISENLWVEYILYDINSWLWMLVSQDIHLYMYLRLA